MLKTLKWVYQLGYKHAETKYYHALIQKLKSRDEIDDMLLGIEDKPKPTQREISDKLRQNDRLASLIHAVFKPEEEVLMQPIEVRNRFEP